MMLRIAFFVCVVIMVNSQVPPVIPVGSITEGPKTTAPPSVKGTEYKMFERKLVNIFLPITFQMCFFFTLFMCVHYMTNIESNTECNCSTTTII